MPSGFFRVLLYEGHQRAHYGFFPTEVNLLNDYGQTVCLYGGKWEDLISAYFKP